MTYAGNLSLNISPVFHYPENMISSERELSEKALHLKSADFKLFQVNIQKQWLFNACILQDNWMMNLTLKFQFVSDIVSLSHESHHRIIRVAKTENKFLQILLIKKKSNKNKRRWTCLCLLSTCVLFVRSSCLFIKPTIASSINDAKMNVIPLQIQFLFHLFKTKFSFPFWKR